MTWLRRLLHRHRWTSHAVTYRGDPATLVHEACRCGAHRTRQLDGDLPAELFLPKHQH